MARSYRSLVYVQSAEQQILDLLRVESACLVREMEARLSDRDQHPLEPHILTIATRNLIRRRAIVRSIPIETRGGREISVLHLPIISGSNKGAIEDASARKRLLQTRFLSWALPSSKYPYGFIGPAGNRALHMALNDPTLAGMYALVSPAGHDVTHLLGHPVTGGSLDSAALHVGMRGGVPRGAIWVLFEVKNIRHWIYPQSDELYQLLFKAAALQEEHPDALIAPVLVCRRRVYWTRQMGIDLGFFVIEVRNQFVLPSTEIGEVEFEEVRSELGYSSLVQLDGPGRVGLHVASLRDALPPYVVETAERWRSHGSRLRDSYERLRDGDLTDRQRAFAMQRLRLKATLVGGTRMDWLPVEARVEQEE